MKDCAHGFVFWVGLFLGLIIFGLVTIIFPRNISSVNRELLNAGLACRDWKTGNIIWNDKMEEK